VARIADGIGEGKSGRTKSKGGRQVRISDRWDFAQFYPVTNKHQRAILLTVAHACDGDTLDSHISKETVAERALISLATLYRELPALEATGALQSVRYSRTTYWTLPEPAVILSFLDEYRAERRAKKEAQKGAPKGAGEQNGNSHPENETSHPENETSHPERQSGLISGSLSGLKSGHGKKDFFSQNLEALKARHVLPDPDSTPMLVNSPTPSTIETRHRIVEEPEQQFSQPRRQSQVKPIGRTKQVGKVLAPEIRADGRPALSLEQEQERHALLRRQAAELVRREQEGQE